jgi:inosine-uridine nucleoside N-ribohydrolase
MDWNVQCDTQAALIVSSRAKLTLVTLPATLKAHLRAAHLPRLRASGPVGELLARQSEMHARDNNFAELGRTHPGLPDDLVNFHYDPVTCAVALGWSGATIKEMQVQSVLEGGLLRFRPDKAGRNTRVVTDIDGPEFAEMWLMGVEALQRDISHRP